MKRAAAVARAATAARCCCDRVPGASKQAHRLRRRRRGRRGGRRDAAAARGGCVRRHRPAWALVVVLVPVLHAHLLAARLGAGRGGGSDTFGPAEENTPAHHLSRSSNCTAVRPAAACPPPGASSAAAPPAVPRPPPPPHLAGVGVDGGELLLAAARGAARLGVDPLIVARVAAPAARVAVKRGVGRLAGPQAHRGGAHRAHDDEGLPGGRRGRARVRGVGAVVLWGRRNRSVRSGVGIRGCHGDEGRPRG